MNNNDQIILEKDGEEVTIGSQEFILGDHLSIEVVQDCDELNDLMGEILYDVSTFKDKISSLTAYAPKCAEEAIENVAMCQDELEYMELAFTRLGLLKLIHELSHLGFKLKTENSTKPKIKLMKPPKEEIN